MQVPLVTVTALCYNHSRYVTETLESIRQQDYPNLEVIIIDDCSTDDSVTVVENWLQENHLHWSYIKHAQNRGVTKSLNETLELATGTYYKVIACDDVLLPDTISSLVNVLHSLENEFALVYADVITIDENSEQFGKSPFEERNWLKDEDVPSGYLFIQLAELCFIPAPSVLLRTNVAKEIRFDESLSFEDWDFWLRVSRQYLIKGIAIKAVKYRIHRNSMFQELGTAFINSALLTAQKNMGYNKEADKHLKQFIVEWSLKNYYKQGKNRTYWMWKRLLYRRKLGDLHKLISSFFINK